MLLMYLITTRRISSARLAVSGGKAFSKVLDAVSLPQSAVIISKLVGVGADVAETFPGVFENVLPSTAKTQFVNCTIFQLDQRQWAVEKVWPW